MAINNVNDYYKSMLNKIDSLNHIGKTASQPVNTDSDSKTGTADKVDLSSSLSNLSGYLNYNSVGQYNNITSLAELLNNDSNTGSDNGSSNDLIEMLGNNGDGSLGQMPSLMDYLSDDGSTDASGSGSIDSVFNTLAQENTTYVDSLIKQALSRMSSSANKVPSGDEKENTSSGESIKQK